MLREERLLARLSVRELAIKLKLSAPYVSDLELGRRSWRPELVERYLAALKTNNRSAGRSTTKGDRAPHNPKGD